MNEARCSLSLHFLSSNKSQHYSAIQRDKDTITNCTILIHYNAHFLLSRLPP